MFRRLKDYRIWFAVILILQLCLLVYWGNKKTNFYWDEYYTYANAHYMSDSTPEMVYLFEAEEALTGDWVNASELKDTLTVSFDNSIIHSSAKTWIHNIFHQPYKLTLALMETFFFPEIMSKWSGIILNLLYFVIAQIFIFLTAKRISNNEKVALLAMCLFGLCGEVISMVVFVRMYTMVMSSMAIVTYLHVLMWNEKRWYKNVIYEAISIFLIVISYGDAEFAIVFGAFLIGCFSVGLILTRKWDKVGYYTVPLLVGGLAYLYKETDYLQILVNPKAVYERHAAYQDAEYWILNGLVNFSVRRLPNQVKAELEVIGRYFLGCFPVLIVVCVAFIALLVMKLSKKKSVEKTSAGSSKPDNGLFLVIGGTVLCYLAFMGIMNIYEFRYYSIGFPALAVFFAVCFYCLTWRVIKEKIFVWGMGILITVSAVVTFITPCVENIYSEDKEVLEWLAEASKNEDSYVYDYSALALQECVCRVDGESKILYDKGADVRFADCPDCFLVWNSYDMPEDLRDKRDAFLNTAGYEIVDSHHTYLSEISSVKRIEGNSGEGE